MKNTILIVTMKLDPHADVVIDELHAIGWQAFRLNTEDLLFEYTFSLTPNDLHITDSLGREVSLNQVHAAYYRKPKAIKPYTELANTGAGDFSAQEGEELLRTLYKFPGIKWINDPYAIRQAQVKLPQLHIAATLGLRVPRTMITNRPDDARSFYNECHNDVICKSLITTTIAGPEGSLHSYTHRLKAEEIERQIDSVKFAPTLFQEWIPKQTEIRVTVFGTRVFACEIDSQSVPAASIDWRTVDPKTIPHKQVALPDEIGDSLLKLLTYYNLQFGAIDLIVTPSNEYVFLENNPNGQWYWIEMLTKMPMAKAMGELLSHH